MDIKKLCEDSHRISKEKGWLEDPRPFSAITALIHSEISEALEDYRNNHPVSEVYYEAKTAEGDVHILTWEQTQDPITGGGGYKSVKPCGIPIEFADFIIRIAQYCGTEKWDLDGVVTAIQEAMGSLKHGAKDFEETLALLHADVSMAYLASIEHHLPEGLPTTPLQFFASAWLTTFAFCAANGIDLEKAIKEKQAYNGTRSHRHGGKKI